MSQGWAPVRCRAAITLSGMFLVTMLISFHRKSSILASLMSQIAEILLFLSLPFYPWRSTHYYGLAQFSIRQALELNTELKGVCTLKYSAQDTSLGNKGIKTCLRVMATNFPPVESERRKVHLYICNILFLKYIQRKQKRLLGRGEKH